MPPRVVPKCHWEDKRIHDRVFKHTREMFIERGWEIDTKTSNVMNFDIPFEFICGGYYTTPLKEPTGKLFACIYLAEFGVNDSKSVMKEMELKNISHVCIVVSKSPTPYARKSIKQEKFRIEVFEVFEMAISMFGHALIPKHVAISNEKQENLIPRFANIIRNFKHQIMLPAHPIARYYFFRSGVVVRVHAFQVSYRIVD